MFGILKKLFTADNTALEEALRQSSTIIDVRSAAEFKSGSVAKAVNIAHTDIRQAKSKIKKMKQPIILCCATGMRSGVALRELQSMGFENVINGKSWSNVSQVKQSINAGSMVS